jgi:hypothetical protein
LGGREESDLMDKSVTLLMGGGLVAFLSPLLARVRGRVSGRNAWVACGVAALTATGCLVLLLGFRTLLAANPGRFLNPFQKAGLGSLVACALLLVQPFAARRLAIRTGQPPENARLSIISAVGASCILLPPVAVLFME